MKRPQIQQTILLSFRINEFSKYLYIPFEVDEIIVNNSHQVFLDNLISIRNMFINSNLFGIGIEPIPLQTYDFQAGEYNMVKPTSIIFNQPTPINGSYNFSFIIKNRLNEIIDLDVEKNIEMVFIKY